MEHKRGLIFCLIKLSPHSYIKVALIIEIWLILVGVGGAIFNLARPDTPSQIITIFRIIYGAKLVIALSVLALLSASVHLFKKKNYKPIITIIWVLYPLFLVAFSLTLATNILNHFGAKEFEPGQNGQHTEAQKENMEMGMNTFKIALAVIFFVMNVIFYVWEVLMLYGIQKNAGLGVKSPELLEPVKQDKEKGGRLEKPETFKQTENEIIVKSE